MEIEVGSWVKVPARESGSMGCVVPGYKGVVYRVDEGSLQVIETKTHGMRTAPIEGVELVNQRTKTARRMIDKFIEENRDKPRFRSPGNRVMPSTASVDTEFMDTVAERHIKALSERRRSQMAAKKNGTSAKTNGDAKPKRKARSKAQPLGNMKPEDFFHENAKGKSVFKPGYDAKFAACLKRLIAGTADKDDKRIAKAKAILNHPKVAESAHMQELLKAAAAA